MELDALHGGLGDHGPAAPRLGDGHGGGAGQGRLPQHEAHVERLQHVLVALLRHAGVGARHLHHLAAGLLTAVRREDGRRIVRQSQAASAGWQLAC